MTIAAAAALPEGIVFAEEYDLPNLLPGERTLTATLDGKRIGWVVWEDSGDHRINMINVLAPYRRRGIATALFEEARKVDPQVTHDLDNLKPDGKAWMQSLAMPVGPPPADITYRSIDGYAWASSATEGSLAEMLWDVKTGEIVNIGVAPKWRRRGIASGMLEQAKRHAREHGLPPVVHAAERTLDGDDWAHATGDPIPARIEPTGAQRTAGPASDLIPDRLKSPRLPTPADLHRPREVVIDRPAQQDLGRIPQQIVQRVQVALDAVRRGQARLEPKARELLGLFGVRLTNAWRAAFYLGADDKWHLVGVVEHDYRELDRRWDPLTSYASVEHTAAVEPAAFDSFPKFRQPEEGEDFHAFQWAKVRHMVETGQAFTSKEDCPTCGTATTHDHTVIWPDKVHSICQRCQTTNDTVWPGRNVPSSRHAASTNTSEQWMDMGIQVRKDEPLEPGRKFHSIDEMIRTYGKRWGRVSPTLKPGMRKGPLGNCFGNALEAVLNDRSLTYVEGYANAGMFPMQHAWVVDGEGTVYDPTWSDAKDYYGVPFNTDWLRAYVLRSGLTSVFGSEFMHEGLIELIHKGVPGAAINMTGKMEVSAMPVGPPPSGIRYLVTGNNWRGQIPSSRYMMLGAMLGDELIGSLTWGLQGRKVQSLWVKPEHRRRRIAETMLAKARLVDPDITHHVDRTDAGDAWVRAVTPGAPARENNTTEVEPHPGDISLIHQRLTSDDPRAFIMDLTHGLPEIAVAAKTALPSWRDRGVLPDAECVIAPDVSRTTRSYLVYLYGQPHARRSTLAEAKATVTEIYGDLPWKKVAGDPEPHHDKVWGHTTMFNDAPYFVVVDRLPRLGEKAAAADFVESEHPRASNGEFTRKGPNWDRDGQDKFLAEQFGPSVKDTRKVKHPKSGWDLPVGKEYRVAQPKDGEGPPVFNVKDYGETLDDPKQRWGMGTDAGTAPIEYVYRGMSKAEYEASMKRGHFGSDGRGVIADWEGTNAAVDPASAAYYLATNSDSADGGYLVKFKVHPDRKWFTIPQDDYLRTREPIPIEDVEKAVPIGNDGGRALYPVTGTRREAAKALPPGYALQYVKGGNVTNNAVVVTFEGKAVGALQWKDAREVWGSQRVEDDSEYGYHLDSILIKRPPQVVDLKVQPAHQRKGLATAMWAEALTHEPDLTHDDIVLPDGQAWMKSLGSGPGTFYRLHHKNKPWSLTPTSQEWRQNAYDNIRRQHGEVAEGYSCFANPWHLFDYILRRRWEYANDEVVAFPGREVGTGIDHEPLAIPSGQPTQRWDWAAFSDWVLTQPMGSPPEWKDAQYGLKWGNPEEYVDTIVKQYDAPTWERLRGVTEVIIGKSTISDVWFVRSKANYREIMKGGLPSEQAAKDYAREHGMVVVSHRTASAETLYRGVWVDLGNLREAFDNATDRNKVRLLAEHLPRPLGMHWSTEEHWAREWATRFPEARDPALVPVVVTISHPGEDAVETDQRVLVEHGVGQYAAYEPEVPLKPDTGVVLRSIAWWETSPRHYADGEWHEAPMPFPMRVVSTKTPGPDYSVKIVREGKDQYGQDILHVVAYHLDQPVGALAVNLRSDPRPIPDPSFAPPPFNPDPQRRVVEVQQIEVYPEHRRKGLGTAMWAKVHEHWPNIPVMHSWAMAQSGDARALNQTLKEKYGPNMHLGSKADSLWGKGYEGWTKAGSSMPFPIEIIYVNRPTPHLWCQKAVEQAVGSAGSGGAHFADFDPRRLTATQPGLVAHIVKSYTEDETYWRTGVPYADRDQAGNARPVIYCFPDGTNLILSGHHRAVAALLRGEMLNGIRVDHPSDFDAEVERTWRRTPHYKRSALGDADPVRGVLAGLDTGEEGAHRAAGHRGDRQGRDRGAAGRRMGRGGGDAVGAGHPAGGRAAGGAGQDRTARLATYDGRYIGRGLNLNIESRSFAQRIADGRFTVQDLVNALHEYKGVGVWWGVMGSFGDLADFEDYAFGSGDQSLTLVGALAEAKETGFFAGCEFPVVLIAKRPMRDGQPWDPEIHNPLEMGGLMGNSYLADGEQVELVEVRYDDGRGWKSLPATGIRAKAVQA